MEIVRFISRILALPLVFLVWAYQRTFSPDHGLLKFFYPYGYCKFHPTCSEYTRQILIKQGLLGIPRIIKRLLSCTPSSLGGIDYPYQRETL